MDVGIGRVFELSCHEPAIGFRQLPALGDHAHAFLFLGRQDDLGTQKAHQFAALNREGLHHHRDKRVAFGRADHRQPNPGVTRGCLNHGLPRLQLTRGLRRLNDAHGQSVFDRTEGVEGLDLCPHGHMVRGKVIDFDDGRVTHGLNDVLKFAARHSC